MTDVAFGYDWTPDPIQPLPVRREIESRTAELWLKTGAIQLETTGNENSYYVNEFGHEFFCKNYPEHYNVNGLPHKW